MSDCPRCGVQCSQEANFCHVCGTSLETSDVHVVVSSDPLTGRVIADRYRILALVGRGGMGVVYKGEHVHMGKSVAIKLLHGELAGRRDQVRRFKREAQAISRLSNIHTVTIFDYGKSQGLIYLVMEYLEGRDVGFLLRSEGGLSPVRALMILVQLCDSLSEAHDSGIIHRDLKPENVFLIEKRDMKDFVKVLDFGLAKVRVGIEKPDETAHGAILGTPYYMSPEQIRGEEIDPRADIYALGGLCYAMLSGRPPYQAPTPLAVMARHLTDPVPDLEAADLDEQLVSAITPVYQRCLAKEPGDRYGHVEELKEDLLVILENHWASHKSGSSPRLSHITGELAAGQLAGTSDSDGTEQIKEEFERYERKLRVRRVAGVASALLGGACVLALGSWFALQGPRETSRGRDLELNNSPSTAVALQLGQSVRGTLGRRISLTESDHDWYVIQIPEGPPVMVRIHLRRIPSVDTMVQLFGAGDREAIAMSRAGGAGEDEAISGVSLDPGKYYILVRQDLSAGGRPVESISDSYQLKVQALDPRAWESEPNDTIKSACSQIPGQKRQGYVQHGQDRDVFCVKADPGTDLTARLTGPVDLALELAVVDVASGRWTVKSGSEGREIVLADVSCSGDEGLCFQVASMDGSHDLRHPYTLVIE